MDDLPMHLQSCIYGEAGVNRVCTTSCKEVFRVALLADHRDLDTPFDEGEDSPAPRPTWRVAGMVPAPPEPDTQLVAALERLGTRYSQLQHVSLDVSEHNGHSSKAGLRNFLEHGSEALSHATRLTVRGVYSRTLYESSPLPWHKLSATRLGFACTRLDVTSDEDTLEPLLANLSTYFPAVQDVRVRLLPISGTDPILLFSVDAPDSLTHLRLLLSTLPSAPHCRAAVTVAAGGLQELTLCFLPAASRGDGALPAPAVGERVGGDGGGDGEFGVGGNYGGVGGGRKGGGSDHCIFASLLNTPALHTLRGFCPLDPRTHGRSLPALRHVEATFQGGIVHETGLSRDVQAWLREWDAREGPGLVSMRLRMCGGPALNAVSSNALLVWAAANLRFSLALAAE